MNQRRVLVLSNMYPGKISATFGIFIKNHVEALKKRGINVDIAVVSDPRMGKVNVFKKYLKWLFAVMRKILTNGRAYQVVHVHYVFPTGLFGLIFKRLFGTRMVVTAHGGDIDRMPNKSPLIRRLTEKILIEADEIIAVGEGLKNDIYQQFGVPKEKVTVINMGVNREVFKPRPRKESREQLSIGEDIPVIVYAGNIIREKGINELIEAFGLIKQNTTDAELHLVGNPKQESYLHELKKIIADRNIESVYFHGAKPQTEVSRWMSAADVVALPSYMEGFGLAALESMSCHTPVVGSDVGGLSLLLKDNHGKPVEPRDATSLYRGLTEVLSDSSLQEILISNGEQKAQEFDQDRMVDKIVQLYFPGGE